MEGAWWVSPSVIDPKVLAHRAGDFRARLQLMEDRPDLPRLMAELLVGRGLKSGSEVDAFFLPSTELYGDPWALRDMERAVEILSHARDHQQKVLIHGDYDCDGICAVTLLLDGLRGVGIDADFHIPSRFDEGYGLSMQAVERCQREGFHVLVTVDCGSSSHREIEAAKAAGITVIITDHHQVPDPPPLAHALINPQHPDDTYPFKGLCGTAVAFKVLQALVGKAKDQPEELMDLVALATIADVVPLVGENRLLVRRGLVALAQSKRPGLRALLEVAGQPESGELDASFVGFFVAPRLNAIGRLQHAKAGVDLMLCRSLEEARRAAEQLDELNVKRKECEARIRQELEMRLKTQDLPLEAIVEWGHGWHEGVIGITAGRLAEKYGVPALVITVDEQGRAKGSGRSPENVDLFQALLACKDLFSKFGGHPRAGGFSLPQDRLEDLRCRFVQATRGLRTGLAPVWVDATIALRQVSLDTVAALSPMEPFGEANPRPIFLLEGVRVMSLRKVGKGQDHLQLELEQGGTRQRGIAFFQADDLEELTQGGCRYDLLCELGTQEFRGETRVRLQVVGAVRPQPLDLGSSDHVVDRRRAQFRRQELESWLLHRPGYAIVCRDLVAARSHYPNFKERFVTYSGVDRCWDGFVLAAPPWSLAELDGGLKVGNPEQIVVLFGRQELEVLDCQVKSKIWARRHAEALWRSLKGWSWRHLSFEAFLKELTKRVALDTDCVREVLDALLETGVLKPYSSTDTRLVLGGPKQRALEDTAAYRQALARWKSHEELIALFSGPGFVSNLTDRGRRLGLFQERGLANPALTLSLRS